MAVKITRRKLLGLGFWSMIGVMFFPVPNLKFLPLDAGLGEKERKRVWVKLPQLGPFACMSSKRDITVLTATQQLENFGLKIGIEKGKFVKSIQGVQNSEKGGWFFFINGNPVDSEDGLGCCSPLQDGDTVVWRFLKV